MVKPFAIARNLNQKDKENVYSDDDENRIVSESDLEYVDYRKDDE
ncbi:MAG: hypothetical protein ACRDBA_14240 [Clostridium sp.]